MIDSDDTTPAPLTFWDYVRALRDALLILGITMAGLAAAWWIGHWTITF
jgi:hypothetical protein